ncbi:sensor domain-containing protein [Nonomuraea sp. FMUSA5-5]|uniref:Sensor domain-containing protein n=1 Tax=Nonomuraea composti TaxID=2720023 RepID=A0ABX1B998_9ACTN|nr:sensor domain-containing protein [Nonomuraea sp. FMUSA5-5]NJP93112.1 sensor domain-containing protein [Nonomuraea sp. FMUSA5-5]
MLKKLMVLGIAATVLGAGAGEAAAAPSAASLPKGFLLYEAKAAGPAKSWEKWTVSNRLSRRLEVNPCERNPGANDRVTARTITYVAEADHLSEQVVIYRSKTAARQAFNDVRADLKRCATGGTKPYTYTYRWKKTLIGDEALRIGGFFFEGRARYVIVRKGKALAIYAEGGNVTKSLKSSHFRAVVKDARTMAGKVCGLPGVCS